MYPINNCNTTNEIPQAISDAFLREKYGLTEEYAENHPEDFATVFSVVRSAEEALQTARASVQSGKKLTNSVIELRASSKELHTRLDNVIKSSEENTQALRKLAKSSSEMKEITSNIANMVSICANRIFNPVRNGFYFLTGHREPATVLPGENQLAIEYPIDPTNQPLVNEKKNCANLLKFCMVVGGLYLLYSKAQKILCYLSAKE